jgi:hypothetical protein
MREFQQIGQKLKHVLLPVGTDRNLKECNIHNDKFEILMF